jgi:hypothetical protein
VRGWELSVVLLYMCDVFLSPLSPLSLTHTSDLPAWLNTNT